MANRHITILTLAMIATLFLPLRSQVVLQRAFDDFIKSMSTKDGVMVLNLRTTNGADKSLQGNSLTLEFSDASGSDIELMELLSAFEKEQGNAYYNYKCEGIRTPTVAYALGYGIDKGEQVIIGLDSSKNIVLSCFKDSLNKRDNYRLSFALEWSNDHGVKNGRAVRVYGLKPEALLEEISTRSHAAERPMTTDTVFSFLSGNLMSLDNGFQNRFVVHNGSENPTERPEFSQLYSFTYSLPGSDNSDATGEWLTQFNYYRNKLMRKISSKSNSATSYATKLLSLSKSETVAQLSDYEKKLCVKCLNELRKSTNDQFISGLLEEAAEIITKTSSSSQARKKKSVATVTIMRT